MVLNPRFFVNLAFFWAIAHSPSLAQIVGDRTLPSNSNVTTVGNVHTITGGTQAIGNLFHSFQEFSLPTGGTAFFNNAPDIQNIISRVTGNSVSNINGLIRANGTANLFLLNSNGIIFGAGARLDIGGSFLASTANTLKFTDGSQFTTNPRSPLVTPLLTISRPIGLQVGGGQVVNQGKLNVNPGQNLTLLGGSVLNTGELHSRGGEITLAAGGEAGLGQNGSILSSQNQIGFSDGTAISSGIIDVSNPLELGGTVKLLGNKVALDSGGLINANGATGGGKVLLGGDFQGRGELSRAEATYVSPSATIQANALKLGDGGTIVVWSDNSTRAYGTLQASTHQGKGGLIETSSANFLDVSGITVDASATTALGGTWLIDPRNVTLKYDSTANGSFNDGNPNIFTPSGDGAVVDISDIQSQLEAGTNVTISTGSTGSQDGNISSGQSFGITKSTASPVTLTLQAANDITLDNFGINSDNGLLNVSLQADSDNSGKGNINISNGSFQTAGGQFTATADNISLKNGSIKSDNATNNNAGDINLKASAIAISSAGINTKTTGNGNAANINIDTKTLTVTSGSINSETSSRGNAGSININNAPAMTLESASINTKTSGIGNAGNINIDSKTLTITNGGINSEASSTGNTGSININNAAAMTLSSGSINTKTTGSGNAGNINIDSIDSQTLTINGNINSETLSGGNAGSININNAGAMVLSSESINTKTSGSGNAGNINIDSKTLTVTSGEINSEASSTGNAGLININNAGAMALSSGNINTKTSGSGNAGNINIDSQTLTITSGGINSEASSTGNTGLININTDFLAIKDSAIKTKTSLTGNADDVTIKANSIELTSGGIGSFTNDIGKGGNVNLNANSISLLSQGSIDSSTEGDGSAGNVTIETDTLNIENKSAITSNTLGMGNAGIINISANSIGARNNAGISTDTGINRNSTPVKTVNNQGNAGKIEINTKRFFMAENSGITSETGSRGQAGEIKLNADSLELRNNANITTSTFDNQTIGNAGRIEVTANSVLFDNDIPNVNSGLGSGTRGTGNGGEITLKAGNAVFRNRGGIGINTEGKGNAGTLNLTANSLLMENTAIASESQGSGKGGNLNFVIDSDLQLRNSILSVSSNPRNGNTQPGIPGDITIQAASVLLDNARIQGEATAVDGGNITLQLEDLLSLRRNSAISTTAGTDKAGGNGGNININTPFIIAVPQENSDISANAFTGAGGKVDITTQGIFGIEYRPRSTNRSDITASSQFGINGVVTINTPDVDPSRGLVPLPTNLVDPSNRIAQACNPRRETSSFIATGRGGIPASPTEPLTGEEALANWITLPNREQKFLPQNRTFVNPPKNEIVEAQGWVVDGKGDVILVAQAPTVNPHGSWLSAASCGDR
ncbi:MAG: filamentous hemagglutinin N-terminal domain-containing protein [Cyanomargarita calcarea GSE-NOS-MK-12-04C]|jgi:filamentous hemagglutinin family protein|uniref:Filamentous hemagglutinin N-terminal domain-containing protein n=1 Tax=Cyanomargarita calcarea GSE-NOS-MK-12-04C TaxID=2839659 RepID=A0A951QSR1_9CYAN|nr:filamentous hemagglutinin N-terminal domain-containing protein [Cyanomargarita calcarea GSE-NOS-MK-12-04C]